MHMLGGDGEVTWSQEAMGSGEKGLLLSDVREEFAGDRNKKKKNRAVQCFGRKAYFSFVLHLDFSAIQ